MSSHDLSWLVGELRALAGDLDADESSPPLVIAIDQGGHASRAIAFDVHGRSVAESFAPISTFRTGKDRVEHDATEVVESIRTALADLAQSLGDRIHRVIAAGLATQRSSIACWDQRTGKPLAPILSWQDRRNAAFIERLRSHEPEIRERTGLVLSPHYGASKLRWCLDNIDAVAAAARDKRLVAGPLAAWLLRSLLDERPVAVDPANASRTQLVDRTTLDWSPALLKTFGIARDVLPRIVPNRHAFGHVQVGERSIPLVVCTGDQSAMPFAHGPINEGAVYLNIGTGAFMQRLTSMPLAAEGLLSSIVWLDQHADTRIARFATEGTVNGAGSAIDWLNERVEGAHRAAVAMTREQAATLDPPVFINAVSGIGSPFWLANAESRFIGEGNEPAQVVAVLDSIAFLIATNIERMHFGVERIVTSGGLAANDYLCDCIAALTRLPLERSSLQEATATGLAYLIAGEPPQWQPVTAIEVIKPADDARLTERYRRWQAAMTELSR